MPKKAKLHQKLIYLNTDVDKYLNKKILIIKVLESQYICWGAVGWTSYGWLERWKFKKILKPQKTELFFSIAIIFTHECIWLPFLKNVPIHLSSHKHIANVHKTLSIFH